MNDRKIDNGPDVEYVIGGIYDSFSGDDRVHVVRDSNCSLAKSGISLSPLGKGKVMYNNCNRKEPFLNMLQ